jgi:hypothetical protein
MAFTLPNFGIVAGGATINFAFTLSGQDRHAQLALGRPANQGGDIAANNLSIRRNANGSIDYLVDLHNFGSTSSFDLVGGGLT